MAVQLLSDVERLSDILPSQCVRNLSGSGRSIGARFGITYTMGWWKRSLEATVTRANVEQGVEWDHHGNRGFVTRWTFKSDESTGQLAVKTWIQSPPWPFKRMYFKRIKPKWELCYRQALDNVVTLVESDGT